MEALLLSLVSQYPVLSSVVIAIGVFRVAFKPLMAVIKSVTAVTPTDKDDALVAKVETSSVYKGVVWVVDYLTSIKLPGAK